MTTGLTLDERQLALDLAAGALAQAAPLELPSLQRAAPSYLAGAPFPAGDADAPVGLGVELIAPLAPVAVTAAEWAVHLLIDAVQNAVAEQTRAAVRAWLDRHLHRRGATPGAPPPATPLPPDLLRRIEAATIDTCVAAGTDPSDARLVASAVVGRLALG